MKKIIFLIILNIAFSSVIAQVDIATARNQGIGANVTITGIVTNGDELGVIRYIQDNTSHLKPRGKMRKFYIKRGQI